MSRSKDGAPTAGVADVTACSPSVEPSALRSEVSPASPLRPTGAGALFDPVAFGQKVRAMIRAIGMDQKDAAREMGIEGSTLSRICKHGRAPSVENYHRILRWMAQQQSRAEESLQQRLAHHQREAWILSEMIAGGPMGEVIIGPDGRVDLARAALRKATGQ